MLPNLEDLHIDNHEAIVRSIFVRFANRYPDEGYVKKMAQRMRAGTLSVETLRLFYISNPPRDALLEQAKSIKGGAVDTERMRFDPGTRENDEPPSVPTRNQMPERIRRKFFSQ